MLKFQDGLGQMLQTIDILISRLLVGPACLPACLYSQFTSPTVHTKNGATDPPINTRGTGQKKLEQPGQILPPPSCFFCCEWVTSAIFCYMWRNSEAHINQLSTYLDVYAPNLPPSVFHLDKFNFIFQFKKEKIKL